MVAKIANTTMIHTTVTNANFKLELIFYSLILPKI